MTKRLVRLLLLLAVALAVPLQGAAAVAAGQCMAFGHHESGAGMSHAGQEGPDHGERSHHDHAAQQGHSGPHDQDHDAAPDHCAPCVACCAAAAISPSSPSVLADLMADTVLIQAGHSFSGVAPETLDRPPLAL